MPQFLGEKITNLPSDGKTSPVLSEDLAKLISIAKERNPVLSGEILFETLVDKELLFEDRIQRILQNYSQFKTAARFDRTADIEIVRKDLTADFFHWSGSPAKIMVAGEKKVSLSESLAPRIARLQPRLEEEIFGQQEAIEEVMDTLFISAAGLERSNKTGGSFLFRGPTGCGKTELATVIADNLGIPLLKYDMSEYSEPHTVSRLIGSPPGYVGSENGGRLVNDVNKAGCAVVLFDEFEKAHPNIYQLLLPVMDKGVLTDGKGVQADFTNIILIMTSNIGESAVAKKSIGFGRPDSFEEKSERSTEALRQVFAPEFRNRLDKDLIFKDVKDSVMPQIVGKFCNDLREELEDKKSIRAEFTAAATAHLIDLGRQTEFGPRDLHRIIEKQVKTPVAAMILGGVLNEGSEIYVDLDAQKKLRVTTQIPQQQQAYAVA